MDTEEGAQGGGNQGEKKSVRSSSHPARLPAGSEVEKEDVTVLSSHSAEVFCCAWNPQQELLATGSGDATARIWSMGSQNTGDKAEPSSMALSSSVQDSIKLDHNDGQVSESRTHGRGSWSHWFMLCALVHGRPREELMRCR